MSGGRLFQRRLPATEMHDRRRWTAVYVRSLAARMTTTEDGGCWNRRLAGLLDSYHLTCDRTSVTGSSNGNRKYYILEVIWLLCIMSVVWCVWRPHVEASVDPERRCTAHHRRQTTDHITHVLRQLHWLPVRRRVDYKIACLVHQSLSALEPAYLADDVNLVADSGHRFLLSAADRTCHCTCTSQHWWQEFHCCHTDGVWHHTV